MRLYDSRGLRKDLTAQERGEFLRAAAARPERVHTLCATLTHTGCRISEALGLTAARVDLADQVLIFECLKKRRRGIYRAVPVPPSFLCCLERVHGIAEARHRPDKGASMRLWPWSRATGWRRVSEVMSAAGIAGIHATPKGLRHGFGLHAVASTVPLHMLQKWLGHSQISTTSIYADAVGPEERQLASRMWEEGQ